MWKHALSVVAFALALGCGAGSKEPPPVQPPPPGWPAFAFGVEYMEPGLAPALAGTGVQWAKTRLESFEWGASEPVAPASTGAHAYDWTCTDQTVREYQQAGFTQIQSYLSPKSPWGSTAGNDPMPTPAAMEDYRAWVGALIERYDHDGVADMPGLLAPVRYWVIGGEWTGFWGSGDVVDYLALLQVSGEAARAAYPDVRVGTIPFFLYDVFHGNEPTQAQINARLANPNPVGRNSAAGVLAILDRPDLFDYVNIHSLGDYTEIPQTLRWFREQMAQRGYDKPIWFDDAFPMSMLANISWPIIYPLMSEVQRLPVLNALRAVADFSHVDYARNRTWIEGLVAKGTVQKVVTALGEGAIGIQIGNTEDWMHDNAVPTRTLQVNLIGAAAMMGMLDVAHGDGSNPNYAHCVVRTPGGTRPAWTNLQMLAARIGDGRFDAIQRLPLAGGARGYLFARGTAWWIAVWYEDDVLQMPGEVEMAVPVTVPLPVDVAGVRATTAVTVGSTPMTQVLAASGAEVTLPLTSVPVFLEAAP